MALLTLVATLAAWICVGVRGCNSGVKEVGVCLHVYLERDFLSLERIVYPRQRELYSADLQRRASGRLGDEGIHMNQVLGWRGSEGLHMNQVLGRRGSEGFHANQVLGRHHHTKDNYAVIDAYGEHGWVEGPELEDYCSRLGSVIECFEDILVDCDSGYDFFRYRHLLHSLGRVHQYLCETPYARENKFLPFLKLIDCAERARVDQQSCHRPNITINVWNQILRLEVGPELCDSLNTQRSCLLENSYVDRSCTGEKAEDLYKNVSGIFLATWCKLPLPPHLLPLVGGSSPTITSPPALTLASLVATMALMKPL